MDFVHCDKSDNYVTLHDCKADRAYFENGILGFEFSDGFRITPENPESKLDTLVRTDNSRVDFILYDGDEADATVYVIEKNILKQDIRKEWSVRKLVNDINSGKYSFEFLYQYVDGYLRIVQCCLWSPKKPYFRECDLHLCIREVNYHWNRIIEDRVW